MPQCHELLFPKQDELCRFTSIFPPWNSLLFFPVFSIQGPCRLWPPGGSPSLPVQCWLHCSEALSAWAHAAITCSPGGVGCLFPSVLCLACVPGTWKCPPSVRWINEPLIWLNLSLRTKYPHLRGNHPTPLEMLSYGHTKVSGPLHETLENQTEEKIMFSLLPSLP